MREIRVSSGRHTDFVDVTAEVQAAVSGLDLECGAALVFVPHTTAAVTINEGADPDVVRDLTAVLDRLAPWEGGYRHAEGNSAAHVKASLFGSSVLVPVAAGRLRLGTWQRVWFCDFDGPRERSLWVQALAGPVDPAGSRD